MFAQLASEEDDVVHGVLSDLGETKGHFVINGFFLAQIHAQLFEVDQGVGCICHDRRLVSER